MLALRRKALTSTQAASAGRNMWGRFQHPHSYEGVNPSYNNLPQEDRFEEILRDVKPGEKAPLAYQNVREFPDWWKPYRWNYTGEGWFLLCLGGILLFGYSYTNDIARVKGRFSRKVFDKSYLETPNEKKKSSLITKNRV